MVRLFIFLGLLLFSVGLLPAQTVTESLINLRKQYAPLFSGERSVLSIDYLRITETEQEEVVYLCLIQVNNIGLEQQSITLGASIFGSGIFSGSGLNTGSSYLIQRKEGGIFMDKATFLEFFACLNKTYMYVRNKEAFGKDKINTLATCEVENISIGGEYTPAALSPLSFYFKVDEATFSMSQTEIEEIVKTLRAIRDDWIARTEE